MNKYLLFIFLTIFSTIGVYAQKNTLNIGKIKQKKYFQEVDFEFVKGKIIIPVGIEGQSYRFILDTGAPNMISKELNEKLKPKEINTIPVSDANNNKQDLQVVSVPNLQLGELTFENTATLVQDFNANAAMKCFEVDGFIGSNMLRNSIIAIDLARRKITITSDAKRLDLQKKNATKMELVGIQSSPYIWVQLVGEKTGREQLLIDTGIESFYDISKRSYQVFEKNNIFRVLAESEGASAVGAFGEAEAEKHYQLLLPTLKVNGLDIENHTTITTPNDNSAIGTAILEHGIMVLDYRHKRFYIKSQKKKVNANKPAFGMIGTLKNDKLAVGLVWDKDLKDKVQYGDEILGINGKVVSVCDMVVGKNPFKDDNSIILKVKSKNGEIVELQLERKDYLDGK